MKFEDILLGIALGVFLQPKERKACTCAAKPVNKPTFVLPSLPAQKKPAAKKPMLLSPVKTR